MSQVAGPKLRPDVQDRVLDVFLQALVDIQNKEQALSFYNTFFTSVEKINHPKRLGIFIMLSKPYLYHEIESKLRVSPTTVASAQKQITMHGLDGLRPIIKKVLGQDLPNYTYDPDSLLSRGKRVYRNKALCRPYQHFPY